MIAGGRTSEKGIVWGCGAGVVSPQERSEVFRPVVGWVERIASDLLGEKKPGDDGMACACDMVISVCWVVRLIGGCMRQVLHVAVLRDSLGVSGFVVEWWLFPEGQEAFRVGRSSVWSSVINWINRSGFDGTVTVSFHGGSQLW